jgi:hypothetical protein
MVSGGWEPETTRLTRMSLFGRRRSSGSYVGSGSPDSWRKRAAPRRSEAWGPLRAHPPSCPIGQLKRLAAEPKRDLLSDPLPEHRDGFIPLSTHLSIEPYITIGLKTRRFGVFFAHYLSLCLPTCPGSAVSDDRRDFGRPALVHALSLLEHILGRCRRLQAICDGARVQRGGRSQAPSHGSLPRDESDQVVNLHTDP